MTNVEITIGQVNVYLGQIEKNLELLGNVFEISAKLEQEVNHSLVVMPELFVTGYDYDSITKAASQFPEGQVFKTITNKCKEFGAWFYGSIPERDNGRVYNTGVLVNPEGELVEKYRKIHLFGPLGEKHVFDKGETLSIASTPFGKLGLSICYDLRFAEQYVDMKRAGADIFLVVAEWPIPRIDHWKHLLRARAIENQAFIVGVNRVGSDLSSTYGGNSAIYDPMGNAVVLLGTSVSIAKGIIDMKAVEEAKSLFDINQDRVKYLIDYTSL